MRWRDAEDAEGLWRSEVNENLGGGYQDAFARLDAILYPARANLRDRARLALPAGGGAAGPFAHVGRPHPHRALHRALRTDHEHMMAGGRRADIEIQLDARRNVTEVRKLA